MVLEIHMGCCSWQLVKHACQYLATGETCLPIPLRWSLMKGMIEDGVTSVLQDFKVKKIYKSLLQIPTCTLAKGEQNI